MQNSIKSITINFLIVYTKQLKVIIKLSYTSPNLFVPVFVTPASRIHAPSTYQLRRASLSHVSIQFCGVVGCLYLISYSLAHFN